MSDAQPRQSRREMQERLNKQYIDSKINPIVEPMTLSVFRDLAPNQDPVSGLD
jgi:hypothetical protein